MLITQKPIVLKHTAGEIDELRVKVLETFVDRLKKREGNNLLKVVLFGSVARGESRPYSDIDVFVLVKEGIKDDIKSQVIDISVDIDLEEGECKVHLSPFVSVQNEYREHKSFGVPVFHIIDEEGIVLYDSEYN
jgi:predicted nucleotidyltransferase